MIERRRRFFPLFTTVSKRKLLLEVGVISFAERRSATPLGAQTGKSVFPFHLKKNAQYDQQF
jgi:hypothetical protein